jgi:hypothetical protein
LLLPSRGRPLLLKRLFRSIVEYAEDLSNLEIVLYLDLDDKESQSIEDSRLNIVRNIGPHSTMGAYNTSCLKASSGDLVMLMNDDLVLMTPKWDRIIREFSATISDDIYLAYPDDMERGRISTFPILSRKTCDVLSNPFPKEYQDLFIDVHILDIFQRLKRLGQNRIFYLDHVRLDHRHFVDGKVRPDATYTHKNRYRDTLTFLSLRRTRQISARRLSAAIDGEPLPQLPKQAHMEREPSNLAHAFHMYFCLCLTDHGLPLVTRLQWFLRLTKYHAAVKSGFRFLSRRSYTLYGSG